MVGEDGSGRCASSDTASGEGAAPVCLAGRPATADKPHLPPAPADAGHDSAHPHPPHSLLPPTGQEGNQEQAALMEDCSIQSAGINASWHFQPRYQEGLLIIIVTPPMAKYQDVAYLLGGLSAG